MREAEDKNKLPNFNICWLASKVSETLRPSSSSEQPCKCTGYSRNLLPGGNQPNIWLQIHLRQHTQTALMASCRRHPPISDRVWKFHPLFIFSTLFCTRLLRRLEALEPFSHMWLLSQLQSNGVRGWQRLLWNVGSEVTWRKSCVCPQRMSGDCRRWLIIQKQNSSRKQTWKNLTGFTCHHYVKMFSVLPSLPCTVDTKAPGGDEDGIYRLFLGTFFASQASKRGCVLIMKQPGWNRRGLKFDSRTQVFRECAPCRFMHNLTK